MSGKKVGDIRVDGKTVACFVTCPNCSGQLIEVVDSRPRERFGVNVVGRRRVCSTCGERHGTLEIPEASIDQMRRQIAHDILMKLMKQMKGELA